MMLTITDGGSLSRALSMPLDARLKRLLIERRDQLGGDIEDIARFIVVQPGDDLDALETALGFSVLQNQVDGRRFGDLEFSPSWEWLADHGYCFELVFIFDDSGFAHVVLVESFQGIDPELLNLCQLYVTDKV
jgi:hypothetical protein